MPNNGKTIDLLIEAKELKSEKINGTVEDGYKYCNEMYSDIQEFEKAHENKEYMIIFRG